MAIDRVHLPSTGATFIIFGTPEAEAEANRSIERSKQPSKTPWSEAEAIARFKRAMAKPDLNYLCRTTGDGELSNTSFD